MSKKIKILVISDSHSDLSTLNSVYYNHYDCDYFLHAGDSELYSREISPFTSVRGNCDRDFSFPESKIIKTPYGSIYIQHINSLIHFDDEFITENNIKIIIYGHTHVKQLKQYPNGVYVCNPGSLTRPRDDSKGSYLIIEMIDDLIDFKFKNI